jgi:hypothetical protein
MTDRNKFPPLNIGCVDFVAHELGEGLDAFGSDRRGNVDHLHAAEDLNDVRQSLNDPIAQAIAGSARRLITWSEDVPRNGTTKAFHGERLRQLVPRPMQ